MFSLPADEQIKEQIEYIKSIKSIQSPSTEDDVEVRSFSAINSDEQF